MKSISLVTAKIVRQNDNYKYKVVGKGEKYLVIHEDGDNAENVVLEFLEPYAQEPVKITQKTLMKGGCDFMGSDDAESIFKGSIEYVTVDECSGKEKKTRSQYFIKAGTIRQAFDILSEFANGFISDAAITSISRTNIIDVLKSDE